MLHACIPNARSKWFNQIWKFKSRIVQLNAVFFHSACGRADDVTMFHVARWLTERQNGSQPVRDVSAQRCRTGWCARETTHSISSAVTMMMTTTAAATEMCDARPAWVLSLLVYSLFVHISWTRWKTAYVSVPITKSWVSADRKSPSSLDLVPVSTYDVNCCRALCMCVCVVERRLSLTPIRVYFLLRALRSQRVLLLHHGGRRLIINMKYKYNYRLWACTHRTMYIPCAL